MRKLSQLPVVKQVDADFPNGAIINETDTQDGTPVVRELYNDPLVNLYKILELGGVTANGLEDKEGSYQLVEALRKLPNLLNDSEQVLTLDGTTWSVPFDLSLLPDKYFFIAKPTDNYVSGTFVGSGEDVYPFSSTGFNASDELLVVIDQSGVKAYSFAAGGSSSGIDEVFTVMGMPIAQNSSETLFYREEGALLSDLPKCDVLEEVIRAEVADNDVLVTDIFVTQGYAVCVVYFPNEITYRFFQFPLSDLLTVEEVNVDGATFPVGSDFNPYFYADDENLYVTNTNGTDADDNIVSVFAYNPGTPNLVFQGTVTLDASFVKTSNGALKNKFLYTFVSGFLRSFDMTTGNMVLLGEFNGNNGNLFSFNGNIYFTSGEVAKKWY